MPGARTLFFAGLALTLPLRSMLPTRRLMRNAFLPGIPRAFEPHYPLVDEACLAADITVLVGTKDAVTPSLTQLRHMSEALPSQVRVIYTYPSPLSGDGEAYASELQQAAGQLGKRLQLLPVDSFINPFDAWLQAVPLVKTKYTLLMHNDVFLLDGRGHFLSELVPTPPPPAPAPPHPHPPTRRAARGARL